MEQMYRGVKAWISLLIFFLLAGIALPAQATPPLDGTFIYTAGWTDNQINASINEAKMLGMNTLIINSAQAKSGDCTTNDYAWNMGYPQSIGTILNAAQARGMTVYVGLVFSMAACTPFHEEPSAGNTIKATLAAVQAIQGAYGAHPALAGWYIPDEPALAYWPKPEISYSYYKRLVSTIKSISNKPVLVAPYLGGVQYSPAIVGQRAVDFKNATGTDIQVWQDSVGAGTIPVHAQNNQPILEDYFAAISNAIGANAFWSDNELFNYSAANDGSWATSAPISRVKAQLAQSRLPYAAKRIAFIKQDLMSYADSNATNGSKRLYDAYRAVYHAGGGYLRPAAYQWITPPSSIHPDTGDKLFDGVTGDPASTADTAWVGISGNMVVRLDFGQVTKFDWIAAHLLGDGSQGITYPGTLKIYGANSPVGEWTLLSSATLPITQQAGRGDYAFSNPNPLGAAYRYALVELDNPGQTFISELEVVSAGTVPMTQPLDTTPPTSPANLIEMAASSTQIRLSWMASTDSGGVAKYLIYRNGASTPIAQAATTSYSDTAVAANTSYSYSVRAVDVTGNVSTASNMVTVTTPPAVRIPQPNSLLGVPGKVVTPAGYAWITPPLVAYPDTGNKLLDGLIGNADAPGAAAWVGVLGNSIVQIDLGRITAFDWVATQVLNYPQWGITFPSALKIYGSNAPASGWVLLSNSALSVGQAPSTTILMNQQALGAAYHYVQLELVNGSVTFIGELRIAAGQSAK